MESTNLWEFINSNVLLLYSVLLTVIFIITINQYNKLKSKITNLDSNLRSNAVKQGLTLEQWIPISENYPWDHRNFRFLGDPIDGIQFEDNKILLVEFKSGNSRMSNKQKAIQQLV
jgi:predicted Holliday junction resolvase-like endonuclease